MKKIVLLFLFLGYVTMPINGFNKELITGYDSFLKLNIDDLTSISKEHAKPVLISKKHIAIELIKDIAGLALLVGMVGGYVALLFFGFKDHVDKLEEARKEKKEREENKFKLNLNKNIPNNPIIKEIKNRLNRLESKEGICRKRSASF